MTNAMLLVGPGIKEERIFSQEQVDLLKNTFCKGSTNDEFSLFLEVCKSKNLDPFQKQIHAVKRWESGRDGQQGREVMAFQTGIDGFRIIAERTGLYAGQDDPLWCGEDGVWRDVWLSKTPPAAAKCSIYRKGWDKPVTRIAKYSEYVQLKKDGNPTQMWAKMPTGQLFKCAEALALRAGFPEGLSGLYAHEELQHLDTPEETKTRAEKIADAKAVAERKIAELQAEPLTIEAAPEQPEAKQEHWVTPYMAEFEVMKTALGEAGYRAIMNAAGCKNRRDLLSKGPTVAKDLLIKMKGRRTYLDLFSELAKMRSGAVVNAAIGRAGFSDFDEIPSEDLDRVYEAVAAELKA